MAEIELQAFIYQIKQELLAPNPAQRARDPFPLFGIASLELEVSVNVHYGVDGSLRLTVPALGEISAGADLSRERTHLVRIALAPLIPLAEITADALRDPKVLAVIRRDLTQALLKGDEQRAGEPE